MSATLTALAPQPKPLTSYRKYWAQRFGTAPFLPMSRAEQYVQPLKGVVNEFRAVVEDLAVARALVADIVAMAIQNLGLEYPKVSAEKMAKLTAAREQLEKGKKDNEPEA